MVIEDLHWTDSVSEELLGKIVDSETKLRLLLLYTRRPEYEPPWLDRTVVVKLRLEPLPADDIRHLVQARLGVDVLPEALARQVTERAEGNPLFAEEILSFLAERGVLRTDAGTLDLDASAIAAAVPASLQSLLTARVDRLAPKDRVLLQAASVIGRRFDPELLTVAVSETEVVNRLAVMQAQVAEFLVSYTLLLNMNGQIKLMIDVLERYLARIDRLGDDARAVLIRHQYVFALVWNTRYRDAAAMQRETSLIAGRLGDSRSKAYSLAGEIRVSSMIAPKPLDEFEILKREAIKAASDTFDAYIQNWIRFVIGWEEVHRGRMTEARDSAREFMQVGRLLKDPRSTGLGLGLLTWMALISDSFAEALEYSEQSLAVAHPI